MVPVLTAAEMREADRRTIEEVGLPGVVLMESAGAAVARALRERWPRARRPIVLCGKGNNGGDGFVVARHLLSLAPEVFLAGVRGDVKGDARVHMGAYERSGGRLTELADAVAWEAVRERALSGDVIVDALLGTGLNEAPAGLLGRIVGDLARAGQGAPVVAVDIPSGLSSDTGEVSWETVRASLTVTFAAPKLGHALPPACDRVGELVVADIGIPRALLTRARLWLVEAEDAARAFPPRAAAAHKGAFGHVLVVAGSVGKTGAAVLAATAALRTGAGLVTVATPEPALALVAAGRPEAMTEPLPVGASGALDREAVARALALAKARQAVVLGPGLGQDGATREFVREFVPRCPVPLVVDADGLNALAPSPRSGAGRGTLRGVAATVVTPHPGEMARLLASSSEEVQRRRLETARSLAMEEGVHVVLKGQRTVIADPEGRAAVNPTGNPGMATGGTGDVLAGVIGALLARGLDAWIAATAGVYLHGLAGDRAGAAVGQEAFLAGDVVDALPGAIRAFEHARG
ncbi:MAG: NAD(P)H-hydrate dehydratase [Acidobacteria bacterium]|nr:NAD(P)H-hydrate dehydratase [Acidobacteriota bacterium]